MKESTPKDRFSYIWLALCESAIVVCLVAIWVGLKVREVMVSRPTSVVYEVAMFKFPLVPCVVPIWIILMMLAKRQWPSRISEDVTVASAVIAQSIVFCVLLVGYTFPMWIIRM